MSIQSANYLFNTFGLNPYSIDQLISIFEDHGVPFSSKEDTAAIKKLLNRVISMAEKEGGETTLVCIRLVKAILENIPLSELEDCIGRMVEFAKSTVLHSPSFSAKYTGKSYTLIFPSNSYHPKDLFKSKTAE